MSPFPLGASGYAAHTMRAMHRSSLTKKRAVGAFFLAILGMAAISMCVRYCGAQRQQPTIPVSLYRGIQFDPDTSRDKRDRLVYLLDYLSTSKPSDVDAERNGVCGMPFTFTHPLMTKPDEAARAAMRNRPPPITPFDVLTRTKEMPRILEWSRKKQLTVAGPTFWGVHHIYIDREWKHAVVCRKADRTTHVFIGTPIGCEEWRKYDAEFKLVFVRPWGEETLGWKLYEDVVLYRGSALPPRLPAGVPYWGSVVGAQMFDGSVTDEWLPGEIKRLYDEP